MNSSYGSKPPEAFVASYSAPPQVLFDAPPVPPALRLELVEANDSTNRKRGLLDVHLYNLSDHGITIPISRDGEKAYEICGSRPLLKATITWSKTKDASGNPQAEADLYGCDLFKGSTLTLMTGDWITLAGLSFARQARDGGEVVTLTYSLEEAQYSYSNDKLKVASIGLYHVRSN